MDKFATYFNNEDRLQELSQYVHENFKLISTKMLSEIRQRLDITPDMSNRDGYVSLLVSLHGRMFNEMVYSMAGVLQTTKLKFTQVVPYTTVEIIFQLIQEQNPLKGKIRTDVKEDLEGFLKYYIDNIEALRKVYETLPKDTWGKVK